MVLTNQIAGFFDHCYIRKESIDFFKFLYRVITQKKDKSETNNFG